MFLDICIVAYPLRLAHVAEPICFGIVYAIFTCIYYYAGGVSVYVNSNYIVKTFHFDCQYTHFECVFFCSEMEILIFMKS